MKNLQFSNYMLHKINWLVLHFNKPQLSDIHKCFDVISFW